MPYGRRRALLVAVLALLAATALAAPRHLLNGEDRGYLGSDEGRSSLLDGQDRSHPSTDKWPLRGQGAYVLGSGRPVVTPHQHPVPIASVAKVMTAYVVLKHYPLRAGDSGPRFMVGQDDVVDTEARRRERQSVVAVRAGEALTERDALMAILLPSANNVAVLAARQVSGSVASFVAEMNRTARALGMSHTTYTDPSGYDDGTVSTARDQLRLAQVVAKDETLAAMMATRTYRLPVAGEVTNTNALLGHDGFVGMKTGSDEAAGGCLMFRAVWPTESGNVTLIGVVLGQRGDNLITAGLYAAKQLVDRLAPNPAPSETESMSGRAGRPSPGQPGLSTPAGAYRRHIENRIRPAARSPPPSEQARRMATHVADVEPFMGRSPALERPSAATSAGAARPRAAAAWGARRWHGAWEQDAGSRARDVIPSG